MAKRRKPYLIGICGGSASGKSWLANFLFQGLRDQAVVVCQDWYYRNNSHLSPQEAKKLNFDHPSAIEMPLFRRDLSALLAGRTVEAPSYDYASHSRKVETHSIAPRPAIIVEGLFVLQDKKVRELMDLSVFIDVPADERLLRRIRRDVEHRRVDLDETLRLYEHFVRPMHKKFIQPSCAQAGTRWDQLKDPRLPKTLLARIRKALSRSNRSGH